MHITVKRQLLPHLPGITILRWAPLVWNMLHGISFLYPRAPLDELAIHLRTLIPCAMCRGHFWSFQNHHPFPNRDCLRAYDWARWIVALHDDVNRRTNKDTLGFATIYKHWMVRKFGIGQWTILHTEIRNAVWEFVWLSSSISTNQTQTIFAFARTTFALLGDHPSVYVFENAYGASDDTLMALRLFDMLQRDNKLSSSLEWSNIPIPTKWDIIEHMIGDSIYSHCVVPDHVKTRLKRQRAFHMSQVRTILQDTHSKSTKPTIFSIITVVVIVMISFLLIVKRLRMLTMNRRSLGE